MQKKNKFLSIFLCLALIMTIIPMGYISASAETTPSFSGGGTEADPYLIEDLEDLEALATYVNADTDNDCKGLYFKQTADITVTADFVPIGWYYYDSNMHKDIYYYFNGTYDGDNNEINGKIGGEGESEQALFGVVGSNGTIKNVINNADLTGSNVVGGVAGYNRGTISNCINTGAITGTGNFVGGIVGYNAGGTIENCYNTGAVTGTDNVGGVVGENYYGTITNCFNTGTVKGIEDNTEEESKYVGGVVGDNYGTITNCYNTGTVEGESFVGGVLGYNDGGTITNCYNTGTVAGEKNVGGVVGYNDGGTITNCYNICTVTGEDYVGGVVAYNDGGTIENCYYNNEVCTTSNTIVGVEGKTTAQMSTQDFVDLLNRENGTAFEYCEGNFAYNYYPYLDVFGASSAQIAGVKEQTNFSKGDGTESNPFEISTEADLKKLAEIVNAGDDCTNLYFKQTADITVENFEPIGWSDCVNECYYYFCGTYDGNNKKINGTIGAEDENEQALFGAVGSNGTIKNVINNADVKGCDYVGGVVGENYYGTITNCFNTGTIKGIEDNTEEKSEYVGGVVGDNYGTIENCYNTGMVEGVYSVGGVLGYNDGGTITNCYNTGDVTGTYENAGGLVGYNGNEGDVIGTIQNCYNTGFVEGQKYVGGVLGKNYGIIENCYNTGTVTGDENVGGILGYNLNTIENCYNTGTVEDVSFVCGVLGYNNGGTTTNCYYNKDVYTAKENIDGVTGKTTDEMSTQDFVDELNGDSTAFAFRDDVFAYYYPYLTVFGEDSAVVSKEKVEYEVTQGDNKKIEIGTDGTLAFTSEGEFDKFKALYLGDEIKKENLVAATNYKAVSGSTKITLNADYVKSLPLGKQTFTLEFVDGYSVVNLEVIPQPVVEDDTTDETDKPTTDDKPVVDDTENPKTDENSSFAFISILALISLAGAYGVMRKLGK